MTVLSLKSVISHWLRHLSLPCLAQKTITIRVVYLVHVISLLFLIGVLTSCVPEKDAVESSSSGGGASLGDARILWGYSTSHNVIFSTPFTEVPVITVSAVSNNCANYIRTGDNETMTPTTGFSYNCASFNWMAIGK